MTSNLLEMCGNRMALEEEANALREAVKKERSTVEYLKCQYQEQKSAIEKKQRTASAFSHSKEGIISLQQATKQLLQSIEHIQTTFKSVLPSQQHEEVASRIPATDQFIVDWQVALDCLSNASNIIEQRLSATAERARANQVQLTLHDSLRAHAAQAVDRMDAIIRELEHSIEDKRFGILHPLRRVSSEVLKEIFEYAVDEEHAELMNDIASDTRTFEHLPSVAFHISATCRHWREIAIRTPKLWRYICAPWKGIWHEPSLFGSSLKIIGRIRFLRCLELAGERGLELSLRGENWELWKHILMGECTKQWSHIRIINVTKIPSRIPTTSRLSIYSSNNAPKTIELPNHLVSPLIFLSCSGIIPQFSSRAAKLTTLDIYLPRKPFLDLGMLLNCLPSLSRLTLNCDRDYNPSFTRARTVKVHDTLEILSITSQVLPYLASELHFISIPTFSVLEILDLHDTFTETEILRLFKAANSIKNTVTDLSISSSKVISKKQEISTLIRSFSQLKRLELQRFAVTPGLEELLGASTGPSLMQVVIKDYPEGNEKLREIIEAAGPKASSWTISY